MDSIKNSTLPDIAFIVGMHRSGTTLLTNMLNSNPEVISTPENEFVLFSYRSFMNADFSDAKTVDAFLDVFNSDFNKEMSIWKPASEVRKDIEALEIKNFQNVCKLVYLNYPFAEKNKSGVKCIVDKNPSYSMYMPQLKAIYPNAKFIVLTRDHRDNVLSRIKYAHHKTSIFELAASWNLYYDTIFKNINSLGADHKVIRYEDLVADSENVLKSICEYLNVNYSPEMLQFQDLSKKIKKHVQETESSETFSKINTMHSNLDETVNVKRVKAYEKELTKEQISILDYVCFENGKKFSYLDSVAKKPVGSIGWRVKKMKAEMSLNLFYKWRSFYYRLPVGWRLRFLRRKE